MSHSDETPSSIPSPEWQQQAPRLRVPHRSHRFSTLCAVVIIYLAAAYMVVPLAWKRFERRHPATMNVSRVTVTGDHHPGDPINVALIGSEQALKNAMLAAGWFVADPLGLESDLKIAADTVLDRPYKTAPVSNLFLWGHREDVAFEQPVGDSPGRRHHVRFWKSEQVDIAGRPAWVGSATYDDSVGVSHTTGQITHHIDGNVDAERDHLMETLKHAGKLNQIQAVSNFHQIREGRNGGGDLWHTDGRLLTATLSSRD